MKTLHQQLCACGSAAGILSILIVAGLATSFTALAAPGDLDTSFNVTLTRSGSFAQDVFAVVQPDRTIVLAGGFTSVNGVGRNSAARVSPVSGALDAFDPNFQGGNPPLYSMSVQPDGGILAGGAFSTVGGSAAPNLARLNTNGTLDTNFMGTVGAALNVVANDSGGTNYIGGAFGSFANLLRLTPNGGFDFGLRFSNAVRAVAFQSDGRIIVGGAAPPGLARFNLDGSYDPGFVPAIPPNLAVAVLAVQADDKILVTGSIGNTNVIRLNANGSLDTNFHQVFLSNNGQTVPSAARGIVVQTDGKILVGGGFQKVDGIVRAHFARLNTNGTLDTGFTNYVNAPIFTVALQADGKILIGGQIGSVNGITTSSFARLENDPATQSLSVPDSTRVRWLRGGSSPEAIWARFEISMDGGSSWNFLGRGGRIADGWELTGLSLPAVGQVRARAQVAGGGLAGGVGNGGCSFGMVESIVSFTNTNSHPVLSIRTAPTEVNLSWPTNFPGWLAQANWVVSDPNGWVALTNIPVTNGDNFPIGLPATNSARFFRLRAP